MVRSEVWRKNSRTRLRSTWSSDSYLMVLPEARPGRPSSFAVLARRNRQHRMAIGVGMVSQPYSPRQLLAKVYQYLTRSQAYSDIRVRASREATELLNI